MAFNAFANFGDIKGESTDKDHKDWVSILKYDHAVTQPPSVTQKSAGGRSAIVLRSRTRRSDRRRVEVGNLLWMHRIANVEHPDAGVEVTAGERRCLLLVVHAAVVAAVHEYRQPGEIGQNLAAVCRVRGALR